MLELLHPGYAKREIMFNSTCVGWATLDVSGFWYFEPLQNGGRFASHQLREIVHLLEGLNAPLEKESEVYFAALPKAIDKTVQDDRIGF